MRLKPWKVASAGAMSLLLVFGQTAPVLGNPVGGSVAAGSATISSSGSTETINQSTSAAIINWQQFSINSGELTKFLVPSNSSATLNRVLGGNPSLLYGTLQSNGIVYLVNPSGIVVGPNGRIDTAGFIGSTLDITNEQFLQGGNLNFVGGSGAGIENEGVINASSGDVYLIAGQISNSGTINAPQGNVGFAAGSNVLYEPVGDQHLFIQSNPPGTTRAVGVTNSGTVRAATAELRAAGGNAYALAINNTGSIAATGFKKVNGQVYLTSDGGNISNSGSISAQNSDGSGGSVVLNAHSTTGATTGTLTNSGSVTARGTAPGTTGGTVELLGDQVGITGSGLVDVSGEAGGGTALVGGGEHGADASVPDAEQTYLGPQARVNADALLSGSGGKIILWGNQTTQAYGQISAHGGAQGGNGGFVETSGASLDLQTVPVISAPNGQGGTWLLDPYEVDITDNGGSSSISSPYVGASGVSTINQSAILSALQSAGAGGHVIIEATGTADDSVNTGTIEWSQPNSTPFDISSLTGNPTLYLEASTLVQFNNVTIHSSTGASGGSLNLDINEPGNPTNYSTPGNVQVLGSTIELNGGNFSATGQGFTSSTSSIGLGEADGVDISDSIINTTKGASAGGNIYLDGTAGYYMNTYYADPAVSAGTGVFVGFSVVQTAGSGAINNQELDNSSISYSGSVIESQNGKISITGTVASGSVNSVDGSAGEVFGVDLEDDSTVEATGSGGAVEIVGNTQGSSNTTGDNVGIEIKGYDDNTDLSHVATVSSAGDGLAFVDNSDPEAPADYYGIYLQGTGGSVTNTVSDNNYNAVGFDLTEGATVTTASGSGDIHIYGTGGSNTDSGSYVVGSVLQPPNGSAEGVNISTDKGGNDTVSAGGSGIVYISGNAGSTPAQGIGVLIAGTNGCTTLLESNAGDIDVFGQGGSGYTGTGYIVGQYAPNYGIAVADGVTLQSGGSGAINLNGYGGANSFDVGIEQLPAGSFDTSSTIPTPVITAGGAFNVDTNTSYIGGQGVYLNATVTAASAMLGAGSNGDVTSITSGPLEIENSSITLYGGDFDAFGMGSAALPASLATLSGISIDRNPNGLSSDLTTINTNGGNINLTGEANYTDVSAAGGNVAGEGVYMLYATLETEQDPGGITITGDASVRDVNANPVTVQNSLQGVEINTSSLTTVDGQIYIDGTVNSGTAETTIAASDAGYYSDASNGVAGVVIVDGSSGGSSNPTSTLIEDTGSEGSIAIFGDTTGSIADASGDTSTSDHNNHAVHISDSQTQIISYGDGEAVSSSAISDGEPAYGIYIQGEAGTLENNQNATDGSGASSESGVQIKGGATVEGVDYSAITIYGSSHLNSTLGNSNVGSATGVIVTSDGNSSANSSGNTLVETDSGNVTIAGQGGTSPRAGIGVVVVGTEGSSATVGSTSGGNITFNGTGGTSTSSGYGGDDSYLANFGVIVADKAIVETNGSGTISLTGTGVGPNSAGVAIEELSSANDSTPAKPSISTDPNGSVTLDTLSNTDVVVDNTTITTGEVYIQPNSSTGQVYIMGSTFTLNGSDENGNSFVVNGSGTTFQPLIDVSGTYGGPYQYYPSGILVANSTINATAGEGTINVTGQAAVLPFGSSSYGAGVGVAIQSSTLETAGTGGITIVGHGGVGNYSVVNDLTGVAITDYSLVNDLTHDYGPSTVTAVDGLISITGDVESGTSLGSSGGGGATGIAINGGSQITATGLGTEAGEGGAISLEGDTSGATTDGSSNATNDHDNRGVVIAGVDGTTPTTVSSKGDGFAYYDGSSNYYGIYIQGGGGTINNNQEAANNEGAAAASGIEIVNGAVIQGFNASDITMVGQGGTNNTLNNDVLGSAIGVDINSNNFGLSSPGNVLVTTASGSISITGTGGQSPNAGTGVIVAGFVSPYTAQVTSTAGGTITLNGTGASGNSGPGSPYNSSTDTTYPDVVYGHNNGVSIVGASKLVTNGTGGININGAGVQSGTETVGVTFDQLDQYAGPIISAPVGALTVTTTVGSTDSGDIFFVNSALPLAANADVVADGVSLTAAGGVSLTDTYVQTAGGDFSATGVGGLSTDLDGINVANSTVDAQGGSINLTGTAGTLGGSAGYAGIYLGDSSIGPATLMTTGSGGITLMGTGSTSSSSVIANSLTGVTMNDGSQISVVNGAINITGHVISGTTSSNVIGVDLENGANVVKATGTGSVTITGTDIAGASVSTAYTSSYGVLLNGATISAFDASGSGPSGINITGTSGSLANESSDSAADGIEINGGTTITTFGTGSGTGTAPIALYGTGGTDINTDQSLGTRSYGIFLINGGSDGSQTSSITSASGAILLNGTGGVSPVFGAGVEIYGNGGTALVSSTSGAITLTGTIPSTGVASNLLSGVGFYQATASTQTGAISITGTVDSGSVASLGSYPSLSGVSLGNGTTIQATATNGSVNISGTDTGSTASYDNIGVEIYGDAQVLTAGGSGGVMMTGYGGNVASPVTGEGNGVSAGIDMETGTIKDSANGPVTLEGYSGNDTEAASFTSASYGVYVSNTGGAQNLVISTGSGPLSITGEGEYGAYQVGGVALTRAGGAPLQITSTSGDISLDGYTAYQPSESVSDELFGVALKAVSVATGGTIDLTGEAESGTAGDRVLGVRVSEGSSVVASGTIGDVTVIGDTAGSDSLGINTGVVVEGADSTISASGSAGLIVTGTAGGVSGGNTSAIIDVGGDNVSYAPATDGILVSDGGSLAALTTAPMTLTGIGGANSNTAATSSSSGVAVLSPVAGETSAIVAGTGSVSIHGQVGSSGNGALYAIQMGGANNVGSVEAGSSGLISFISTGSGDINLNGVESPGVLIDTAGNVTQDGLAGTLQNGPVTTSLLTITNAAAVTLTNAGNAISALGSISHSGALTLVTDPGLAITGVISGNAPVTLEETGGDITFDAGGQILDSGSGNNVILAAGTNLATSHYVINDASAGANAIDVTGGAGFDIFSGDPGGDSYNGIVFTQPDVYNATFSTSSLPVNGAYYYAAQGAVGPNPPPSSNSGGNNSSDNSDTNNTQSQLTPPNNTINPQPPPPEGDTGPFSPTGDNENGNGNSNQTGNNGGQLANSSGSTGDVGSGDAAQLNDGQLNNVSNPAATAALNQALGAVVQGNLTSALNDLADYGAADTTGGPGDNGDATGGNGNGSGHGHTNGTTNEQDVTGGGFVEIGGGGVQNVPANKVPAQLQDALSNNALQAVPTQTSH
jgi:filamentous hemagglutinin family protein